MWHLVTTYCWSTWDDSKDVGSTSPPHICRNTTRQHLQRIELHTCWKYLSQLMYSLSWESCSLLVLMYCQRAWMMQERVWVWMPSRRARRGSSLNWGGCGDDVIALKYLSEPPTQEFLHQHQCIGDIVIQGLIHCCYVELLWNCGTPTPSPGSPASAAGCSAHSRLPAVSPGSRRSPGWWACDATESTNDCLFSHFISCLFHTWSSVCFTLYWSESIINCCCKFLDFYCLMSDGMIADAAEVIGISGQDAWWHPFNGLLGTPNRNKTPW